MGTSKRLVGVGNRTEMVQLKYATGEYRALGRRSSDKNSRLGNGAVGWQGEKRCETQRCPIMGTDGKDYLIIIASGNRIEHKTAVGLTAQDPEHAASIRRCGCFSPDVGWLVQRRRTPG